MRQKLSVGSGVVAIVGIDGDGKAGIVVGVTPDLTGRFDAVQLVRPAAVKLGGKVAAAAPTWLKLEARMGLLLRQHSPLSATRYGNRKRGLEHVPKKLFDFFD